ncbi:MAG: hypothetical protein KDA78_10595 [Planctomycetaceae bacterium]|nr:hypothetical protein [Planctomycetaceae bacterium]
MTLHLASCQFVLMTICLSQSLANEEKAELHCHTDFPGGSAEVVSIDEIKQHVQIRPRVTPGRGYPCNWYLCVEGIDPDRPLLLTVQKNLTPFQNDRVLDHSWSQPDRASLSYDNAVWQQTELGIKEGDRITYRVESKSSTIWIAWGPPFHTSHLEALLSEACKILPEAERFELAVTREGRSVQGIRFGCESTPNEPAYGVWVQARQHAWEWGSSWVGQGFLLWAISDDPVAQELRRTSTIHFIPIMDVDSAVQSLGGKDSIPRDHNRDWDNKPYYPEVAAAQQKILKLDQAGQLDLFIDLHNPGPGDKKPFYFGPKMDSLDELQQRNYLFWVKVSSQFIDSCESDYRFTSYIKNEEELNRVSSNWVRNHTQSHLVSTTLETAWNRPEGNQQGYQKVGRELGISIARYLQTNPRLKSNTSLEK